MHCALCQEASRGWSTAKKYNSDWLGKVFCSTCLAFLCLYVTALVFARTFFRPQTARKTTVAIIGPLVSKLTSCPLILLFSWRILFYCARIMWKVIDLQLDITKLGPLVSNGAVVKAAYCSCEFFSCANLWITGTEMEASPAVNVRSGLSVALFSNEWPFPVCFCTSQLILDQQWLKCLLINWETDPQCPL